MAATVHVTISTISDRNRRESMPALDSIPLSAETLTSSGSSAQGTITASAVGQFWTVTVTGGNVWVNFGADPTAASGSGRMLLSGQSRDFAVVAANEKIAIKDV